MRPVVDVDGLTSEWISSALQRDVEVLSCQRIGAGMTSATYRLHVTAPGLPHSIVAKVGAGDDAARQRVRGGIRAEVGMYTQVLATVDVRAPHCWYAAVADDALQFTLLLEDLAPRFPGIQVEGCSAARALDAVRNLVGLHAPRWNDESLFKLDFVRRSDAPAADFLGGLTRSAAPVFIERYGNELSADDVDTLRAAAAVTDRWVLARGEPFGLLHGDYRLDNLMFDPADQDVVAVDWQAVMIGPPTRDVAYFLGTSLDIESRRTSERQMVSSYHDALVAHGVRDYSAERCFEDYRVGHLQGTMITMVGSTFAAGDPTPESDAMFLAMARRSCAAIRDLGTLDLL